MASVAQHISPWNVEREPMMGRREDEDGEEGVGAGGMMEEEAMEGMATLGDLEVLHAGTESDAEAGLHGDLDIPYSLLSLALSTADGGRSTESAFSFPRIPFDSLSAAHKFIFDSIQREVDAMSEVDGERDDDESDDDDASQLAHSLGLDIGAEWSQDSDAHVHPDRSAPLAFVAPAVVASHLVLSPTASASLDITLESPPALPQLPPPLFDSTSPHRRRRTSTVDAMSLSELMDSPPLFVAPSAVSMLRPPMRPLFSDLDLSTSATALNHTQRSLAPWDDDEGPDALDGPPVASFIPLRDPDARAPQSTHHMSDTESTWRDDDDDDDRDKFSPPSRFTSASDIARLRSRSLSPPSLSRSTHRAPPPPPPASAPPTRLPKRSMLHDFWRGGDSGAPLDQPDLENDPDADPNANSYSPTDMSNFAPTRIRGRKALRINDAGEWASGGPAGDGTYNDEDADPDTEGIENRPRAPLPLQGHVASRPLRPSLKRAPGKPHGAFHPSSQPTSPPLADPGHRRVKRPLAPSPLTRSHAGTHAVPLSSSPPGTFPLDGFVPRASLPRAGGPAPTAAVRPVSAVPSRLRKALSKERDSGESVARGANGAAGGAVRVAALAGDSEFDSSEASGPGLATTVAARKRRRKISSGFLELFALEREQKVRQALGIGADSTDPDGAEGGGAGSPPSQSALLAPASVVLVYPKPPASPTPSPVPPAPVAVPADEHLHRQRTQLLRKIAKKIRSHTRRLEELGSDGVGEGDRERRKLVGAKARLVRRQRLLKGMGVEGNGNGSADGAVEAK